MLDFFNNAGCGHATTMLNKESAFKQKASWCYFEKAGGHT